MGIWAQTLIGPKQTYALYLYLTNLFSSSFLPVHIVGSCGSLFMTLPVMQPLEGHPASQIPGETLLRY